MAPVVGDLLTDACAETDSVLVAGGSWMHRVEQFQTRGVTFASVPSIDQVGDRWSEIVDLEGAVPGVNPAG